MVTLKGHVKDSLIRENKSRLHERMTSCHTATLGTSETISDSAECYRYAGLLVHFESSAACI